jgi:uncharacterized protein YlzI (FlbEa/FlbD family)
MFGDTLIVPRAIVSMHGRENRIGPDETEIRLCGGHVVIVRENIEDVRAQCWPTRKQFAEGNRSR